MARRILAVFVAILALATTYSALGESATVYVKANSLPVYAKPSTSAKKLGTMNFGEHMEYVDSKSGWVKVKNAKGDVGFCKESSLTLKNPNGSETTYYAKSDGVKAYKRTSSSSGVLYTFKKNAEIQVVATTSDGKWHRVKMAKGYGFIKSSKLAKKAEESAVYVSANTAQVYQSKSSSSKKLGVVSYGQNFMLIKTDGSWAQIRNTNGSVGWIKKSALTAKNPNGDARTLYAAQDLSLYSMPESGAKKLGEIKKGDGIEVVALTGCGKWLRAKTDNGHAYVQKKCLTDEKPKDEKPKDEKFESAPINEPQSAPEAYRDPYKGTGSATVEKVAAYAVSRFGKEYVYATRGPETFDCAGLMYYCYGQGAGVSLSRSAYGQGYNSKFERIEDISSLRRGDMVCFNTVEGDADESDHTGLYLGGGLFIHASSSAGKVIVSSLSSGYYNRVFSWGLRIID